MKAIVGFAIGVVLGTIVFLILGCASYHARSITPAGTNEVRFIDIGGGNRVLSAPGIATAHSNIPETIGSLGDLANEIGKATTPGGTVAGEVLKK